MSEKTTALERYNPNQLEETIQAIMLDDNSFTPEERAQALAPLTTGEGIGEFLEGMISTEAGQIALAKYAEGKKGEESPLKDAARADELTTALVVTKPGRQAIANFVEKNRDEAAEYFESLSPECRQSAIEVTIFEQAVRVLESDLADEDAKKEAVAAITDNVEFLLEELTYLPKEDAVAAIRAIGPGRIAVALKIDSITFKSYEGESNADDDSGVVRGEWRKAMDGVDITPYDTDIVIKRGVERQHASEGDFKEDYDAIDTADVLEMLKAIYDLDSSFFQELFREIMETEGTRTAHLEDIVADYGEAAKEATIVAEDANTAGMSHDIGSSRAALEASDMSEDQKAFWEAELAALDEETAKSEQRAPQVSSLFDADESDDDEFGI